MEGKMYGKGFGGIKTRGTVEQGEGGMISYQDDYEQPCHGGHRTKWIKKGWEKWKNLFKFIYLSFKPVK